MYKACAASVVPHDFNGSERPISTCHWCDHNARREKTKTPSSPRQLLLEITQLSTCASLSYVSWSSGVMIILSTNRFINVIWNDAVGNIFSIASCSSSSASASICTSCIWRKWTTTLYAFLYHLLLLSLPIGHKFHNTDERYVLEHAKEPRAMKF